MTGVPALSFLKAFLYDFFAKVPASLSEEAEVFTCSSPGLDRILYTIPVIPTAMALRVRSQHKEAVLSGIHLYNDTTISHETSQKCHGSGGAGPAPEFQGTASAR